MATSKKTVGDKKKQLEVALRALLNANNSFRETRDEAYLLDLMGRLRALVAMGGRHMTPLLITLAEELAIPLVFYSSPPRPKSKQKGLAASILCGKTWSVSPQKDYVKYNLRDWLEAPAYFADKVGEYRSRNQALKNLSNTEGGAHYSEETPHIVDTLSRWKTSDGVREFDGNQNFLLDLATLIYWLGTRLLYVAKRTETESLAVITEEARRNTLSGIDREINFLDNFFDKLNHGAPRAEFQLLNTKSKEPPNNDS